MKQRPTKAIIPVAGYGTRRLPITKSIEKCMLPILNRPLIDYIVEDCRLAGIVELIFIISGDAQQLRNYYAPHTELEGYLADKGKVSELQELVKIGEGIIFRFVEQPRSLYGTAVPVWAAKELINENEAFVVLMGDDFIVRHDDTSSVAALINAWNSSTVPHALIGVEVSKQDVSKYGVLEVNSKGILQSIIEKPSIESAPSTLINVSKYVFDHSIFDQLSIYMATERIEEYFITDIVSFASQQGNEFLVVPAHGTYLDGGTVEGWLHANNFMINR